MLSFLPKNERRQTTITPLSDTMIPGGESHVEVHLSGSLLGLKGRKKKLMASRLKWKAKVKEESSLLPISHSR